MPDPSHLTVGQVAEFFAAPEWRVRRIVDSLNVKVPRAGLYRLIPRDLLPMIGATPTQARQRGGCQPMTAPADSRRATADPVVTFEVDDQAEPGDVLPALARL